MHISALVLIAALLLLFGLISKKLQKSVITPPMVFVFCGLMAGPAAFGLFEVPIESELIRTLAEATLVLVLFTDASRIDLSILRRHYHLPVRLLGIGLPLTIAGGALLAAVLFDQLTFWEAAVAAAILAPTDAALGQAVVSSPRVPVRIRQALNVESGLNDGIVLPVVLILLSLAAPHDQLQSDEFWVGFVAGQIILGPIVGIAVGYIGGRVVSAASTRKWMDHTFQQLAALALAGLAFGGAELVGGNGFIAAFTAGLTLGNSARQVCGCLQDFAEAEGQLLALLSFLFFGAADAWPAIEHLDPSVILYSLLSLTVIRMLPSSLSLIGTGFRPATHLFLGWFGPRGLASILFLFFVLEEQPPGAHLIFHIVITTVLMSVFAHGLSAFPGANWYATHSDELRQREGEMPEHAMVEEIPVRLPHRD